MGPASPAELVTKAGHSAETALAVYGIRRDLPQLLPQVSDQFFNVRERQAIEMRSQMGGKGEMDWLRSFLDPDKVMSAYCVGANTDEGWLTVGNGNQNPAVILAVVPAAAVGMLAAIAVPNFVRARSTAQVPLCTTPKDPPPICPAPPPSL